MLAARRNGNRARGGRLQRRDARVLLRRASGNKAVVAGRCARRLCVCGGQQHVVVSGKHVSINAKAVATKVAAGGAADVGPDATKAAKRDRPLLRAGGRCMPRRKRRRRGGLSGSQLNVRRLVLVLVLV